MFFTNLGMVGMNVGLDVRVIDQIGLANPIAQHTERLKHGRIGHDKNLFPDWVIADGPWVKWPPGIPGYIDQAWVAQAVAALQCPETKAVLSSVRAPMSPHRFMSNFVNSFDSPDTGSTVFRFTSSPGVGCRCPTCHPLRPAIDRFWYGRRKNHSQGGYARPTNTDSKVTIERSPARDHAQAHAETAILRAAFAPKTAVNYRHSDALDESPWPKL